MIEIRRADPGREAASLADLAAAAFQAGGRGWAADTFRQLAPGVVCLADTALVHGLLIVRIAASEAEVLDFGVVPTDRRRGLGRALLRTAITEATQAGADRLILEVAADNHPAMTLYTAEGFLTAGHRPAYYQREAVGRVDALTLTRQL
ncbi:MAG: GNAT family N-acetyltransferase [Pseudomonadota bacterium]